MSANASAIGLLWKSDLAENTIAKPIAMIANPQKTIVYDLNNVLMEIRLTNSSSKDTTTRLWVTDIETLRTDL